MQEKQWYEKFRWFVTSSGKFVIGGKSAEQNEEVIKGFLSKDDIVMHTSTPGSPFAVIKSEGKITNEDLKEAAIFCASFSQQWKKGMKKAEVHIFNANQIIKEKSQKTGTFSVIGKVQKARAELELALTMQNGTLRAVPASAAKEKFLVIKPGKIPKEKAARIIKEKLHKKNIAASEQEILQALPAGGFSIQE